MRCRGSRATLIPAEKLGAQGIEVRGGPPAERDAVARKEIPRWAKAIKDNHIKSGD